MSNNTNNPQPAISVADFFIYNRDGTPKENIAYAFLKEMEVSAFDISNSEQLIKTGDGKEWKVFYTNPVLKALKEQSNVNCIASFQALRDPQDKKKLNYRVIFIVKITKEEREAYRKQLWEKKLARSFVVKSKGKQT